MLFVFKLIADKVNDSQPNFKSQQGSKQLSGMNVTTCSNPGVGYWTANVWTAAGCSTKQWKDKQEVTECFRNKSIYFLGDSTTRQWTITVLFSLLRKWDNSTQFIYFYSDYFKEYNFNLTFQFYPHILSSTVVAINEEKFEVDILDSLRDPKCRYVVLISPWAHFAQWWLEAYKRRVMLIADAIKMFKKRCPHAAVIVKSPHVRDHGTIPQKQFMSSDYILFKIKAIMEEVLNIDGVYYIDVWNMNLAYPGNKTIHMPESVIRQELNLFLSYICPY